MNDQILTELRTVEKMLAAYLQHEGLLQWIDGWAAGNNEGGNYCALYNSRANFRICNVYVEDFDKLPDFIRSAYPADPGGEASTDRARVEKQGRLVSCPMFQITRYKLDKSDDQSKWKFGAVIRMGKKAATEPAPARPQPQPAAQKPAGSQGSERPPTFDNLADALNWAVAQGAFPNYDDAGTAYGLIKAATRPKTATEMFSRWISHVMNLTKARREFPVVTGRQPANGGAR